MSTERVVYEMSLKDLLSSKIDDANHHVNKLEGSLGEVQETLLHVAEAVGIAFGLEKIIEFGKHVKEITQEFEGFENRIKFSSSSTMDATQNMGYLEDVINRLRLPMKETYEGFSEMQAGLIGTGIEGDKLRTLFEGLSTAATVLHLKTYDLQRTLYDFKEIGEIGLNGRIERSLSTAFPGINEISREAFGGTLKQVQEMGISGAAFLEKIGPALQKHFAEGLPNALQSLQAKTNEMNNSIMKAQLDLGVKLRPLFIRIMSDISEVWNHIKEFVGWIYDHREPIKEFAEGIGIATAAFGLYTLVMSGATIATNIYTAAIWLASAAMYANPIGFVVAALGTLIAFIIHAYNHVAKFRAHLWAAWAVIKEFGSIVADVFIGLNKIILGALTLKPKVITDGFSQMSSAVFDSAKRIGEAARKGYNAGIADFVHEKMAEGSLIPKTDKEKTPRTTIAQAAEVKGAKTKATGQKVISIRIDIKELIHEFKISTTNFKEAPGKASEMVAQALLSAVNDSQIVAGS